MLSSNWSTIIEFMLKLHEIMSSFPPVKRISKSDSAGMSVGSLQCLAFLGICMSLVLIFLEFNGKSLQVALLHQVDKILSGFRFIIIKN